MPLLIYKKVGETPLEAINRLRFEKPDLLNERLSYAGRLDPLAEGLLLILVGDECNDGRRQSFLGLEKEYELCVLFGFSTDSCDLLGIMNDEILIKNTNIFNLDEIRLSLEKVLPSFIGAGHGLKYPAFSSKTVNGKQLFAMAKSDEGAPVELPSIKGQIKSIDLIDSRLITKEDLSQHIKKVVSLVNGDFRQEVTLKSWESVLKLHSDPKCFPIFRILVKCESGVYMRSLANEIGSRLGLGGLAFSIKRTRIGDYNIQNTL